MRCSFSLASTRAQFYERRRHLVAQHLWHYGLEQKINRAELVAAGKVLFVAISGEKENGHLLRPWAPANQFVRSRPCRAFLRRGGRPENRPREHTAEPLCPKRSRTSSSPISRNRAVKCNFCVPPIAVFARLPGAVVLLLPSFILIAAPHGRRAIWGIEPLKIGPTRLEYLRQAGTILLTATYTRLWPSMRGFFVAMTEMIAQ